MEALGILARTAIDKGDPGFDYAYGAGIVNAAAAVAYTPAASPLAPSVPAQTMQVASLLALFAGVVLTVNPRVVVA